jgi:alkyl hydroperoxide reductase subunit AhpF
MQSQGGAADALSTRFTVTLKKPFNAIESSPSMNTPHESHQHYQLAVIGVGSGGREATLLAARKGVQTV